MRQFTPHSYQKEAISLLNKNRGGAVWSRVGSGKTAMVLLHFATIAKLETTVIPRFIVVCKRTAFYDWEAEVTKLSLDWFVTQVDNEEDLYRLTKPRRPVLYLCSHGMLSRLRENLSDIAPVISAIAYDEGFLYKNPSTKHCKAANRISELVGDATIVSGSMMTARDLTDVFGQLYAIDQHHVLARTLTEFRSKYMFKFHINPDEPYKFKFLNAKRATQRVAQAISRVSFKYFENKTRRRVIHIKSRVSLNPKQKELTNLLKEEFWLEHEGKILDIKNTPTLINKCQQISDGWINMGKGNIFSFPSEKMEYLLDKVEELLSEGEKIVIWCAFVHSAQLILQRLQKLIKTSCYLMTGKHKLDIAGWQKDGRVAISTVGSGSSINHFRNCAYGIYYSMSVKWLDLQQSRGRTNRDDSLHGTCYYYYLHSIGSLDSFVYQKAIQSMTAEQELIQLKSWASA